jgi:hypothetical protein
MYGFKLLMFFLFVHIIRLFYARVCFTSKDLVIVHGTAVGGGEMTVY